MSTTNAQQFVTALEAEREGYKRRGDEDRLAAVDEQLAYWRPKADRERREAAQREEDYLDPVEDEPRREAFLLPGADPNAQRIRVPVADDTLEQKNTRLIARVAQLEEQVREAETQEQRITELTGQLAGAQGLRDENETLTARVTDLEEQLRDARRSSTPDTVDELKTPSETAPNVQETGDVFTLPEDKSPTDDDSAAEARKAAGDGANAAEPSDAPRQATSAKKPRQTR